MALSAAQRSTRARHAALVRHSRTDGHSSTAAARDGFLRRFLTEVDPDGVLPEAERIRRAERARRAHMLSLSSKSARARSKTT
jgi:hypothetical protein